VLGVQREALRKDLTQTVVGGGRVLDHRGIRLQQDVDGGDEASAAIPRLVPRASMARAHAIDPLSQSRLELSLSLLFPFVLCW